MAMDLGKTLSQLANSDGFFNNPYEEEDDTIEANLSLAESNPDTRSVGFSRARVSRSTEREDEDYQESSRSSKKEKKKLSKKEKLLSKTDAFIEDNSEWLAETFDGFLGTDAFYEDEDIGLKNTLNSLGRKYARDTEVSKEQSEYVRAFSQTERACKKLLEEIEKDRSNIQKDIDAVRAVGRGKNYRALQELTEAKATYQNTALGCIKELSNIKKIQFDLQMKAAKDKQAAKDAAGEDATAGLAIQKLFGMGRESLIGSVGGFEGMSGAMGDDIISMDDMVYHDDEERALHDKYVGDEEESDGDKFLKYENDGVEYILLIDKESGDKNVIAEDREGNLIPDYPMPSNLDQLSFDIVEQTATATDNLHRSYKLRYV